MMVPCYQGCRYLGNPRLSSKTAITFGCNMARVNFIMTSVKRELIRSISTMAYSVICSNHNSWCELIIHHDVSLHHELWIVPYESNVILAFKARKTSDLTAFILQFSDSFALIWWQVLPIEVEPHRGAILPKDLLELLRRITFWKNEDVFSSKSDQFLEMMCFWRLIMSQRNGIKSRSCFLKFVKFLGTWMLSGSQQEVLNLDFPAMNFFVCRVFPCFLYQQNRRRIIYWKEHMLCIGYIHAELRWVV